MSGLSPDALVRLNVAAKELGVAVKTVKQYCRNRRLHCRQLPGGHWRVYRSSLNDFKWKAGIDTPASSNQTQLGVYVVKCEEFIKIGRATHVGNRIQSAQTFMPWRLELLLIRRCVSEAEAIQVEAEAHVALAAYRHRGEWFVDCCAVRSYIECNLCN